MMRTLTCIVCPIGCTLTIGEEPELPVSGNRCPRGAVYAREEILSPRRVVTATCGIAGEADKAPAGLRRVPVKSSVPCPREQIPELLADIYKIRAVLPVKSGDAVIADWRGTGLDVLAVREIGACGTMHESYEETHDFAHFEAPLGDYREDLCDKSQESSISGSKPYNLHG
jgi:CxxC motif-containing protein